MTREKYKLALQEIDLIISRGTELTDWEVERLEDLNAQIDTYEERRLKGAHTASRVTA